MIKPLIGILVACLLFSAAPCATESEQVQPWDDGDGVKVQSQQRVEQINAQQKKSLEAERKKSREFWKQNGVTVQPEARIEQLDQRHKQDVAREIRALKCAKCTARCEIVRDAGLEMCTRSTPAVDPEMCRQKAARFFEGCIQRCEDCVKPE